MNYLTSLPGPLTQDNEDNNTLATNPFSNIPFTNQSAFQSAFTPEGFSFTSPFQIPQPAAWGNNNANNTMNTSPTNTNTYNQPSPLPANAYSVNFATGDRFSQLLEAKLESQPPPTNTQTMPLSNTSDIERALHDYTQIQIPPDFVAPPPPPAVYEQGSPYFKWALERSHLNGTLPTQIFDHNIAAPLSSAPDPLFAPIPIKIDQLHSFLPSLPSTVSNSVLSSNIPTVTSTALPSQSSSSTTQPSNHHLDPFNLPTGTELGSWASELLDGYKSATAGLGQLSTAYILNTNTAPQQTSTPKPEVNGPATHAARIIGSVSSEPSGSKPRRKRPKAEPGSSGRRKSKSTPVKKGADVDEDGEKKIIIACHMCRARKLKCDGARPKCHNCTRRKEDTCVYDAVIRRRGPGRNNKKKSRASRKRKTNRDPPDKPESEADEDSEGSSSVLEPNGMETHPWDEVGQASAWSMMQLEGLVKGS